MKYYLLVLITALSCLPAFSQTDNGFLKTSSGLLYKIYKGGNTTPAKDGDILKMHVIQRVSGSRDSILSDTHGKMPAFVKLQKPQPGTPVYGPDEIFDQLKKGDSLIALIFIDSLISKGLAQEAQLPPFLQRGDKVVFNFKVLEVFQADSLAQSDYEKEMERDAPRAEREQKEMMEKMNAERAAMVKAEDEELRNSGEMAKQTAYVENYLKNKNIKYVKSPLGSFVKIETPGTGGRITDGKFVTVKYKLIILDTDSTIEENSFVMKTGEDGTIRGFEDGLKLFQKGGKGTIYIPGYLAYGKNPPPIFKPYEHLIFDIEVPDVSDVAPIRDEELPEPPPAIEELKEKQ